ncbi:MAG TPA: hypothetical protein VLG12_00945 [Candidatus Saccharimonadales bacterium]|nr:hypothetical protein [Candidatus Saccharimonadales bacterium]
MSEVFHWNETLAALESGDRLTGSSDPTQKLCIDTTQSDTPDKMRATYVPHEAEVCLGTVADLQRAWQTSKNDPQIIAWLDQQRDKISPSFDGRTVLVTATIDNGNVTYAFSANYRSGSTYRYPLS